MTTTEMPLADLAAMRARTEHASAGPWKAVNGRHGRYVDWEVTGPARSAHGGFFERDAVFIAHARTDLGDALDEINRLRTLVSELEADAAFLGALEAAGVDNWVGYGHAQELHRANATAGAT